MTIKDPIVRDIFQALNAYRKFRERYYLWFTLYADPLSDDILSDIHEQALAFARQYKILTRFHVQ